MSAYFLETSTWFSLQVRNHHSFLSSYLFNLAKFCVSAEKSCESAEPFTSSHQDVAVWKIKATSQPVFVLSSPCSNKWPHAEKKKLKMCAFACILSSPSRENKCKSTKKKQNTAVSQITFCFPKPALPFCTWRWYFHCYFLLLHKAKAHHKVNASLKRAAVARSTLAS